MVRALIPGQRTRALTALIACALLLSFTFATPVSAAGPLKLTAGSADPDSGVAGSTFGFAATYVSKDDEPPAYVRVIVNGKAHEMTPNNASDSDMRDGARYQVRFKIKTPGTYTYSFVALDAKGREASLAGGSVTVTPKPKPKPTSAPVATPGPTSAPVSKPRPTSVSDGAEDRAAALAGLLALDYDGGPGSDGYGGGGPGALGPDPFVPPASTLIPGAPDTPPGRPDPGRAPGADGQSGAGTSSIAALAATLPGFGSDQWLVIAARSALIATGSAAMVAMALFTFKRRRREDEDPDDLPTPDEESAGPTTATTTFAAPLTGEMAMPRWRRPSLAEARKSDPGTSLAAIEAERLTFARGAVAGDPANERRRIRYRMVRLSDSPDEVLGQEIGRLDQGDEVELLERSGLYWKVRTPLGEIGWVHKMTLGDVVTSLDPSSVTDDAEADIDVLAAFNDAQARRGSRPQAEPVLGEGLAAQFIREHGVS